MPEVDGSAVIRHRIADARAWTGASLREREWRVPFPQSCLSELERLVAGLEREPVPTFALAVEDYRLDACRALMGEMRDRLDRGPGVVVLDRLPIETWSRSRIEDVFWLLGTLLARPVVQTIDGTLMVEVTDTGVKKRVGVRGFRTNVAQPPHVDNSFNHAPPDYVSLVSLRAGISGGASRFVSFVSVHNRLREESPELLERLYRPFLQDRQGDFLPGEPQTVSYPLFERLPGEAELRCRYTHFTIPAGYVTAGVDMDELGRAAFEAVTALVDDPTMHCELEMRPGELQFVNNRWCGHGRTAYVDDPAARRLLLRLWHRNAGRRGYSG